MPSKFNAVVVQAKHLSHEAMAAFRHLPPKFKLIFSILLSLAAILLVYLFIKWAFLDKPNDYEWHFEKAAQALEADNAATLLSNPRDPQGRDIVAQIRENPTGMVNGVQLQPIDKSSSGLAVQEAKKSVQAVEENNRIVAAAGGIATLDQVQQTYNGQPQNPEQALKVQRVLEQAGVNTGVNVNAGLTEAQLGAAAYTDY